MAEQFTEAARRVPMSAEVKQKQQRGESLGKEPEMAYKKPKLVAKTSPQQSFVAGCPAKTNVCGSECKKCERTR